MIQSINQLPTHTIEDTKAQIEHPEVQSLQNVKSDFMLVKSRTADVTATPRKVNYYSLSLCLQGSCTKRINDKKAEVSAGSLFYVTPHHVTATSNCSSDFKCNQLFFKKDFLMDAYVPKDILEDLLWIDPAQPPLFDLQESRFNKAKYLFEKLENEAKLTRDYYIQIIRNSILELLFEMNRLEHSCLQTSIEHSRQSHQLYNEFKDLVDKHYKEKKHVTAYADLLHVTPKHLSETVKKESGSTALQHIHQRIIREAKNLLTYTDQSAKEIAYNLDFKTPSHFGRFFKRRVDISPIQYRKSRKIEH